MAASPTGGRPATDLGVRSLQRSRSRSPRGHPPPGTASPRRGRAIKRGVAGSESRSLDPAPSWTVDGRSLPVLPYGPLRPSLLLGHLGTLYRGGLKGLARHPAAIIPVEKIRGVVLLICGEDDSLWPSCEMAGQLEARATVLNGPHITVLAYNNAGHESVGVPLSPKSGDLGSLSRWGGTNEGNNAARTAGWPQIVELLRG